MWTERIKILFEYTESKNKIEEFQRRLQVLREGHSVSPAGVVNINDGYFSAEFWGEDMPLVRDARDGTGIFSSSHVILGTN